MELQENLFWLFMNDAIHVNKLITNNKIGCLSTMTNPRMLYSGVTWYTIEQRTLHLAYQIAIII